MTPRPTQQCRRGSQPSCVQPLAIDVFRGHSRPAQRAKHKSSPSSGSPFVYSWPFVDGKTWPRVTTGFQCAGTCRGPVQSHALTSSPPFSSAVRERQRRRGACVPLPPHGGRGVGVRAELSSDFAHAPLRAGVRRLPQRTSRQRRVFIRACPRRMTARVRLGATGTAWPPTGDTRRPSYRQPLPAPLPVPGRRLR